MGFETDIFRMYSFNRKTYNYKWEVDESIASLKKETNAAIKRLHNLAIMTEPDKYFSKDDDIFNQIEEQVDENISIIRSNEIILDNLEFLSENWDKCHNKDGIANGIPENLTWNTVYIDGDFIKTTKKNDEQDGDDL